MPPEVIERVLNGRPVISPEGEERMVPGYNAVWAAMKPGVAMDAGLPAHPISAAALKPVLEAYAAEGKPFNLGMVFPVSTHNYELRYWLAAGGVNPGFYQPGDVSGQVAGDVLISVTPPPQIPRRWRRARLTAMRSASRGTRRRWPRALACR